jgi:GTP-binding protein
VIVSEIPHTTKEPQDTMLTYRPEEGEEKHVLLIDTVGIRKKARVEPGMEYIGVGKSFDEMRQADVALLLVDSVEGIGSQEKKLVGLIDRGNVGVVVLANKWDRAEGERIGDAEAFRLHLAQSLPFCRWSPMIYISALTGRGVDKILPTAFRVMAERKKEIPPERMELFNEKLKKSHHLTFSGGPNVPKVYGIKQIGTEPPRFELIVKKKETVHLNFMRFVENRLREEFGFEGTPIVVSAREISK